MQDRPPGSEANIIDRISEGSNSQQQEYGKPYFYSRRETIFTMIGLMMVLFLATLDQTIVSTATPRIIADLQGFDRIAWVSTAYLLTSTVMIPIYGKLSDLFGRKLLFLCGIAIFLTGSALSGAAHSIDQLILFRGFQGLGAGALQPLAVAIVGDLFSPRERGRWQGLTGSMYMLAAIVGPLVGGWLTDHATWRWVFYVNIPVGIIAFLVLIFLMPTLRSREKAVAIDYTGFILLVLGTVPLLIGFTVAGSQYAWLSPQVLALFGSAIALLALLVAHGVHWEQQGKEPVLEPGLFKSSARIFGVSIIVTVIFSISLFGSAFGIPLFIQGVTGASATNSGLVLMPFMLTAIGGSILAGQLISWKGKYKWIAIAGLAIAVAGTLLLVRLDVHSSNADMLVAMLVLGLGVGSGMAVYTTAVQNALPRKIGQATSAIVFFRQLGGTIGLAAMGSVLTSSYVPAFHNALAAPFRQLLPPRVLAAFDNPLILLSPDTLARLRTGFAAYGPQGNRIFDSILTAVKIGLAQSLHNVFVLCLVTIIFGLLAVFFLEEIPLRTKRPLE